MRVFWKVSCWAKNRYYVKHKKNVTGEKHSKTKEMGLKRNYVLVFNGYINEYK